MSSRVDSHVRMLAEPGSAPACPPAVQDCTGNWCEPFAWYDRSTRSWKTWQRCLMTEWESFSGTWPRSGLTRNGIAYQRKPSAPLMNVTVYGSLPTPTVSGNHNRPYPGKKSGWVGDAPQDVLTPVSADPLSFGCGVGTARQMQSGGPIPDGNGINPRTTTGRPFEQSGPSRRAQRAADASGERCGQGRAWRPPDSFAWIRDEARRNAADPLRARLSFGESLEADACSQLSTAERAALAYERQSLWPDESALCGVDDGVSHRVDRIRALGNALLPQIPEMIGRAILAARDADAA